MKNKLNNKKKLIRLVPILLPYYYVVLKILLNNYYFWIFRYLLVLVFNYLMICQSILYYIYLMDFSWLYSLYSTAQTIRKEQKRNTNIHSQATLSTKIPKIIRKEIKIHTNKKIFYFSAFNRSTTPTINNITIFVWKENIFFSKKQNYTKMS